MTIKKNNSNTKTQNLEGVGKKTIQTHKLHSVGTYSETKKNKQKPNRNGK